MRIFRIYYRIISRSKIFSIISVGGFALSMAVVLLLVSFIHSEKQYDRSHPDLDQIYRMYRVYDSRTVAQIPQQCREVLETDFPSVIAATNVNNNPDPVLWNEENNEVLVVNTDSSFFWVFGMEFIRGKRTGLFIDPHEAVITESCARRIFGDEDPIGQILNVSHREDVQVVALVHDLPEKSSLQGELFISTDLKVRYSRSRHNESEVYFYNTFLKLHPGTFVQDLENSMSPGFQPFIDWQENNYFLQPFREVYFDTRLGWDGLDHANVKLIGLLGWLALVILILSVFNYINLTVAQSSGRLFEFGVKQVFGADRKHLIRQFISEAFLQILLAFLLSLAITVLIRNSLQGILGKEIHIMEVLSDPVPVLLILTGLVVIAAVSGVYPGIAILRLKPGGMLLKQVTGSHESFDIRRLLTILQFTASVTLIICLITLARQVSYVQNKDLGYRTDLLIRVPVHYRIEKNVPVLLAEISGLASVKDACATHGTPGAIYSTSSNNDLKASHIASDYRFLETFDLEILYGRNFHPGEEKVVGLINETMMEELGGWDSVESRVFFGAETVGVIGDFHYRDLYHPVENLQINNESMVSHLNIRFRPGDIQGNLKDIEKIFTEKAPGFAFTYDFYDDWLASLYRQEEKRARSIRLLSIIAVLLSCMGLFGMAEYSSRNRTREIGIRKVNGASTGNILWRLNIDFLKWVLIGLVPGIPAGWFFMDRWLSGFAYRTALDWWIFAVAALGSVIIAVLTISWQTWRAARQDPVKSLRYE